MGKIRVLHFANVINRHDIIDTVLTQLDRDQFEVASLTVRPPNNREGSYAADEAYSIKCLDTDFSRRNYRKVFSELKAEIERFKPHILQTHHYDESVMGALLARFGKIPSFVIGHHYSDHIYLLTRGLKRAAYLGVEKLCNNAADKVVVPTQEVYDLLLKQGNKPDKVERIPFGVDTSLYEKTDTAEIERLRNEFGLNDKFVAFVGCRLNKEKGLQYLLQAVPAIKNRHANFRLVIAGTGTDEEELRGLATELDIDSVVQFIGWRKDLLTWFALADIVVQPSLAESFGQTLTEALTFETPVIMTPVGIAPEIIINDERGGELVPIADTGAIEGAIEKLIGSAELRKKLGKAGREYVSSNLGLAAAAEKYKALYLDLVDRKNLRQ